jgi:hypothetical protein
MTPDPWGKPHVEAIYETEMNFVLRLESYPQDTTLYTCKYSQI